MPTKKEAETQCKCPEGAEGPAYLDNGTSNDYVCSGFDDVPKNITPASDTGNTQDKLQQIGTLQLQLKQLTDSNADLRSHLNDSGIAAGNQLTKMKTENGQLKAKLSACESKSNSTTPSQALSDAQIKQVQTLINAQNKDTQTAPDTTKQGR